MAYRTKPEPPRLPPAPPHHDPPPQLHRHEVQLTIVLPPGSGLDLTTKLNEILAQLRVMQTEEKKFMADQTVRLDKLDAATTKLATVLQELRDAAVNGMSPADAARFDATIATLEAMGADPANPLPEVPAEPA